MIAIATIGCDSKSSGGGGSSPATPTVVITSNGGGDTATININENETAVATVAATSSEDINYTIGSGGDGAIFGLNITSGVLTFLAAPDFENPIGTGANNDYTVTVVATSTSGIEDNQSITVNIANIGPTDVALSSNTVAEVPDGGLPLPLTIGTLSNTDADTSSNYTYTLVSGTGDTDNSLVSITGTTLKGAINFETNPTLSVRVEVSDDNISFAKAMVITVTDVNEAPTDIALSSNTVAENSATGTAIGTLSNTDVDTGNTYTYSLVSGTGDTDNTLVSISGTTLKVAGAIDFETNPTLEIRVNVNDGVNDFFEAMVVNVTDVNTAPTGIALSNSDVDEEVAVGTVVGTISATDDGEDGTLSYSFDGGTDDVSFTIDGTSLKTDSSFDFETKASYSIDIKVNDGGTTEFTKTFTITINDTVEDPIITMCGSTQTYGTVTNATTGKTWLDRNLGASQVATSSTDHLSYGALFQWGRASDGHECITWTSSTTGAGTNGTTNTKEDNPGHSDFITGGSGDWRVTQDDTLWDGTAGANNPCPTGFRLPTKPELQAEIASWATEDAAGAFGSVLKLPISGYRYHIDGLVYHGGIVGYYWTSNVFGIQAASYFEFGTGGAGFNTMSRIRGHTVRCIQD